MGGGGVSEPQRCLRHSVLCAVFNGGNVNRICVKIYNVHAFVGSISKSIISLDSGDIFEVKNAYLLASKP
jgi:hypothetical protein